MWPKWRFNLLPTTYDSSQSSNKNQHDVQNLKKVKTHIIIVKLTYTSRSLHSSLIIFKTIKIKIILQKGTTTVFDLLKKFVTQERF